MQRGSPMPRLPTIAFVALIVALMDVTWDGSCPAS